MLVEGYDKRLCVAMASLGEYTELCSTNNFKFTGTLIEHPIGPVVRKVDNSLNWLQVSKVATP